MSKKINWQEQSILVTGGTGSFGKKFVEVLLRDYKPKKIIVFSRDELKQFEMKMSGFDHPSMRYFLGDVRDGERFRRALDGVDIVVHAAALKQVPAAEYNPMEFIKTNIIGAENIINAVMDSQVKSVVALSTDKAAAPVNLYGATKLCSDKLFITANNIKGSRETIFSVVRYGNVIGSRGSVIPFFLKKRDDGTLPITDPNMTRFNISLEDGVKLVIDAIEKSWGGEIWVPKLPSYRITDVAKAVAPSVQTETIGIRPGEKLHEDMITENDSLHTIETEDHYLILPDSPSWNVDERIKALNANKVEAGFRYNSGTNDHWLTIEELREQIKLHIDPSFSPL